MIEKMNINNVVICSEMANKLWPHETKDDLKEEYLKVIESDDDECFLAKDAHGDYIAFIQLSIRHDYVEGSETSPVAYIEGIYTKNTSRRSGIASHLIEYAGKWGKSKGCSELASDCELDNQLSIEFHHKIGFEEANRIVCFIKAI